MPIFSYSSISFKLLILIKIFDIFIILSNWFPYISVICWNFAHSSNRVAELVGKPVESLKTIVCHLGQGASLCAVNGGKSVDTSMGFTPLAGIAMGTRSGDLDPSIVTFLMKKEGLTPDEVEKVHNICMVLGKYIFLVVLFDGKLYQILLHFSIRNIKIWPLASKNQGGKNENLSIKQW